MTSEHSEIQALKAERAALKLKVSEVDNARNKLSMELGAAIKDAQAHEKLKEDHAALKSQLDAATAKIGNLEADLKSAASKGGRDSEVLAAAKQVAEGIKRLG